MRTNEEIFQKLWHILYSKKKSSEVNEDSVIREAIGEMYGRLHKSEPDYDEMWNQIERRTIKKKSIGRVMLKYAVVIALPILLCVGGILLFNDVESGKSPLESPSNAAGICLTLADGSKVNLKETDQEKLLVNESVVIKNDSLTGLVYEQGEQKQEEVVYNLLEIPAAADYRLCLADGTIVYLNSQSKLKYPVVFVGEERKVYLEGEAYFEVTTDADRPFRVEVCGIEIEVLGTCFNVNAYPERQGVQTTLASGKVRVKNGDKQVILSPGEQAYSSDLGIEVQKVNVHDFINWKDGLFVFNKMSLGEIMAQVERWYGLKITFFEEELKACTFTGMIDKNLPVEETFNVIAKVMNVHFSINGKDVLITER
ncbi:MAG: DUF4974 domain-containing protein [Bacteroidales bacterium]|nr:DUF4974 domain-containing protein [Bacteroidales bacterium]